MTDKEAMAMALEALETLMLERGSIYEQAITALKARLADPMRDVQRLGQEIEQEPCCYVYKENGEEFFAPNDGYYPADATPLYTHPPQRTEQNFCPRCGKRTKDMTHIHTCTPPKENT
jgi:hypothetical protein